MEHKTGNKGKIGHRIWNMEQKTKEIEHRTWIVDHVKLKGERSKRSMFYRLCSINKRESSSRGFTLVETLVAISILSLAITGPMTIAQKGIASAIYARDQVTAFYLAQEAIEAVRNVRDNNRLTSTAWLQQFASCLDNGGGSKKCQIDGTEIDLDSSSAIRNCPSGTCSALTFNTINKMYGYGTAGSGGWVETAFTRDVIIEEIVNNQEAVITVTITWKTRLFTANRSFTVKEHIFNF
jgi:prepilin-type N-terminal cleavage/methylation domain-containing protein